MVKLSCSSASRRGSERSVNEDAMVADADTGLFAVADGIGGAAGGEVAATMVAEHLVTMWSKASMRERARAVAEGGGAVAQHDLAAAVRASVLEINEAVAVRAAESDLRGMGTTVTAMLSCGERALFLHAGDSRAYVIAGGVPSQLTADDSSVPEWRRRPAEDERPRAVLTNALGMGDVTRVTLFFYPLCASDRYVLCTDGVHRALDDRVLARVESANDAVTVAAAVEGDDDSTAVVVTVDEGGALDAAQRAAQLEGLAACPLFAEMSPCERLRTARAGVFVELPPEVEPSRRAGGEPAAYVVAVADDDPDCVGRLLYPEALIDGGALRGRSLSLTGPARALVIRRDHFLQVADEEPDLGVKLFAAVAAELAATRR